jgi:hypothetical protein
MGQIDQYLKDSLAFDRFWVRDLWKGVKNDPKRLILGVEPASTWAWNQVLGRDDKPLVDQMGGPYDGRVFSYGHNNGEVFDRAQAAGIDTAAGSQNLDIAHIVALAAMGGGAMGGGGGGGAGGAQPGLWNQGFAGKTSFATGLPSSGTSVASGIPGIAGPVGGGTGASSAAGMGAMDYAKLGMGLAGSAQPQQQNQAQPQQAPVRTMAQPNQVPTYGQRIGQGLGRVSSAMFPVDPSTGLTADQTKQLQTNALMQMGLGMLGSSSQGAGFGEAAAKGYGLAQGNLQGRMQQNYENAMKNRAETRAADREDRLDARQAWLEDRTLARDDVSDKRYEEESQFRREQAGLGQQRWEQEQRAMSDWRRAQIEGATRNPEVRVTDRGMFERDPKTGQWNLIPGTEPTGVSGRPIPQGMANDLKSNAAVIGQIDKLLPQLRTEDGKAFDPTAQEAFGARNAVVDMLTPDGISDNVKNFVDSEGTDLRATVTNLNSVIVKERNGAAVTVAEFARQRGFLPTDKDNVETVEKKLLNLREALASEQQYMLDFAESQGYRPPPAQVRPPGPGLGQPPQPKIRRSIGSRNYVQIDGQWYEDDGTSPGQ